MFELEDETVEITNYVTRQEIHGDKFVLGGTAKCKVVLHNSALEGFSHKIRPLLYRSAKSGEQPELPLNDDGGLVELQMPELAPLKWSGKYPGYQMSFDSGIAVEDRIELRAIELADFTFEALAGGSVAIYFNANFNPGWMDAGKFCWLAKKEVQMTLIAPKSTAQHAEADAQRDIDDPE
jgi:hypothetical protein